MRSGRCSFGGGEREERRSSFRLVSLAEGAFHLVSATLKGAPCAGRTCPVQLSLC